MPAHVISNDSSMTISDCSSKSRKSQKNGKKLTKNHVLKKILKKLQMQKKQFKRMDKIFVAEKQSLDGEEACDPYILRPKQYAPFDSTNQEETPCF